MNITEETIEINGQKLTLQFGKLAQAATTSVFAKLGETCVLVTVTSGKEKPDIDYFPLQVEYAEKLYAGGRIKGSRWVKREGRPSDDAVLKGRLIDRSIRPLFSQDYRKEVQVIITLLSVDGVNSPEILAAIAVSTALHVSPIPWNGPISTLRVGYFSNEEGEGSFYINPIEDDEKYSALDLIVSSTKDRVLMIETKSDELSEELLLKGILLAKEKNAEIIKFIEGIREKIGLPKEAPPTPIFDEKLLNLIKKNFTKQIDKLISQTASKEFEDKNALMEAAKEVKEMVGDDYEEKVIAKAVDYTTKKTLKERILKTKKRTDGRGPDEIRPISVEVDVLPRTHGSALFQRGDTQALSIATLGAPSLEQLIEGPAGIEAERYIHHYFMPPYSVGEVGRMGVPSRREIGHGALASKAIEPVLPSPKEFPYTIRVVSEILSSNGSTSMASTCGSTLALMAAGVPIKAPIAGIAMGLLSESEDKYMILTDIMGIEDFSGEMDFKVTGSANGITAIQLDVKYRGLTDKIIEETLEKARKARLFILDKMVAVIKEPRTEISKFAPKVIVLHPPQDKIGEIIGPGGRNIKALIAKTGTEINISDDGNVTISGLDKDKVDQAASHIANVVREVEVGEKFTGEVKRILPFGAFVEFLPGKEGMIHVSKMGPGFVKDPNDILKIGQQVDVEVLQIDNQGRINLRLLK